MTRQVRQRTHDHTTRPERIEAVTRDLLADLEFYEPAPNREEEQ